MSIPETTSAEGLERYLGGKCLFHGHGEAWRDLKAWIVSQPPEGDTSPLPSVSEPFLAWTMSGEVNFQERENNGPWITNRIKKGSFFLTTGVTGNILVQAIAQGRFRSLAEGRAHVARRVALKKFIPSKTTAIDEACRRYAAIEARWIEHEAGDLIHQASR